MMKKIESLMVALLMLTCLSVVRDLVWGQSIASNSYMQVSVDTQNGNLTISTVQGDPLSPLDDNLTVNDPDNSALILRLYNIPSAATGTGGGGAGGGSTGGGSAGGGGTGGGAGGGAGGGTGGIRSSRQQILGVVDLDLRGGGSVGGVTYSLFDVVGGVGTRVETDWVVYIPDQMGVVPPIQSPSMRVRRECTVVGNAVEIKVRVLNLENRSREIGIGVVLGIALPTPYFYAVSNHSYSIWYERAFNRYTGLPDRWYVFSNRGSFQGVLNLQNASPLPDKLLFADAQTILSSATYGFDYIPNPYGTLASSAVGIYWDRLSVPAKSEVQVTTIVGVNSGLGDYRSPLGLWVIQPSLLGINVGDDPLTDEIEHSYIVPNPFTITAFVCNSHWLLNLSNVTVTLGLPEGLSFPPGESATKVIPILNAREEQRISWQVRVNPGTAGVKEFVVTAFSPQVGTRQVKVPIVIPYLPRLNLKAGYNLVGFPFEFIDPEPSAALGIPPGELQMARYDPAIGGYLVYRRDLQFNRLETGVGYWIKLPTDLSFDFTNIRFVETSQSIAVPIKKGWNLLSNPFPWQVYLRGMIIEPTSMVGWRLTFRYEEAVEQGWVRNIIFVWENNPKIPPYGGAYAIKVGPDIRIEPFQGFWLYSEIEGNIIFEAPAFWGSWQMRSRPISSDVITLSSGWLIQVIASSDAGQDNTTWLGVSSDARNEFDRLDLPKVPAPPGFLQTSSVVRVGRSELPLSIDIRPPQSKIVWTLELLNPAGGEVKLQFEGLAQVPQSTTLLLYDPETNQQWSLRSVSSVTISTQPQQPKRLQVIALQTDQLPLRVQGLKVTPLRGRGAQIQFTVTMPAQVQVQIRSLTGRVIWETSEQVSGGRLCSVFWNGRSKSDEVLPSGVYTVVVRAITENGRQTQAQTILRLR